MKTWETESLQVTWKDARPNGNNLKWIITESDVQEEIHIPNKYVSSKDITWTSTRKTIQRNR